MKLTPKKRTAGELMAELEADPEWRQRRDERARAVAEAQRALQAAEQPVVQALSAAGVHVTSVWDLVNSSDSYPSALPVLVGHVTGAYPDGVRDGIARALAVREARQYWSILKRAYLDEPIGTRTKQGLAAALAAAADDEVLDELIELATTPQHGESRGLLLIALPRSYNPLARQVLESMTSDPEIGKAAKVILRSRRSRRSRRDG